METAVLKVISDIIDAADSQEVTLLGLLDISAAFDTVDQKILLDSPLAASGRENTVQDCCSDI